MKKEGIQTRNRKLSSKSKKKKAGGCLGLGVMGDMIKAGSHLDLDNKSFHSSFGAPMGKSFTVRDRCFLYGPFLVDISKLREINPLTASILFV